LVEILVGSRSAPAAAAAAAAMAGWKLIPASVDNVTRLMPLSE